MSMEVLFINKGNNTYQLKAIMGLVVSSLIQKIQMRIVPNVWIRPPFNIPIKIRFSFSNFTDGLPQFLSCTHQLPRIFMYACIRIILKYGMSRTIDRIKIWLAVIA